MDIKVSYMNREKYKRLKRLKEYKIINVKEHLEIRLVTILGH